MSVKTNIMNSKLRISHEFEKNTPYIHISLSDGDLNDEALKFFVENARYGAALIYRDSDIVHLWPQNDAAKFAKEILLQAFGTGESVKDSLIETFTDWLQAPMDKSEHPFITEVRQLIKFIDDHK